MSDKSLYIILTQFKKEHIDEEETIQLIKDLFSNSVIYQPYYTNPSITWTNSTSDNPDTTHIYCNKCH